MSTVSPALAGSAVFANLKFEWEYRAEDVAAHAVVKNGGLIDLDRSENNRTGCAPVRDLDSGDGFRGPGNLKINLLLPIHVVHSENWSGRAVDRHRDILQLGGQGQRRTQID